MRYIWKYILLISLLSVSGISNAAQWSGRNAIDSIQIMDDQNIVRLEITSTFNPASCLNTTYLDFYLDAAGRSETMQRQLLDTFNMALLTRRPVEFLIVDDDCSTIGTSSTIRIGVGVRVNYN
jgi:hypothetical protein